MTTPITRRTLMTSAIAASAVGAQKPAVFPNLVQKHDEGVERTLKTQNTDPKSRWRGTVTDEYGLWLPAAAGGIADLFATAYMHPESKFYKNPLMLERVKLATDLLNRELTPDGNINNPITNFNSPPDTAFLVRGLAVTGFNAKTRNQKEIFAMVDPILRRTGASLVRGGIHTPNHRWVLCAALAQLHSIYNDPAYLKRIDQWLAESIDIDPDGQYDERSTSGYNAIVDNALTTLALKLKRPALLDPVRKNLDSMMYLMHPDWEVVTEISHRQDLNTRGDMANYWFAMHQLALLDKNGRYMTLSQHYAPVRASLSAFLEYPELSQPGPAPQPLPDNYEKRFPTLEVTRIRRGPLSATLLTNANSRFFAVRKGGAVVNAVRFVSAFFGKSQFLPTEYRQEGTSHIMTQRLEAPYYQPFTPTRIIHAGEWTPTQKQRPKTEICKLEQSATVTETAKGFRVRIQVSGTNDVPVAVEVNLREGGQLEGCTPAYKVDQGFMLSSSKATYRVGKDVVTFGPGKAEHNFTVQMRGALPKLSGPSVYLTGYSPFDHTLEFELS